MYFVTPILGGFLGAMVIYFFHSTSQKQDLWVVVISTREESLAQATSTLWHVHQRRSVLRTRKMLHFVLHGSSKPRDQSLVLGVTLRGSQTKWNIVTGTRAEWSGQINKGGEGIYTRGSDLVLNYSSVQTMKGFHVEEGH